MKFKNWIFLMLFFWSCKDKYTPVIKGPSTGFLVVEGFINSGGDSTIITLSRSSSLDSIRFIPETGADIEVQSENGGSFPLSEQSNGKYFTESLPVDVTRKYRLHIKTRNGKEYLSDLSEVKISPPIDSINFTGGTDKVTFNVSTHDSSNKSIYYEWSYTDTWEYSAKYISKLIYVFPVKFIPRPDQGKYFTCYKSGISSGIEVSSTAKLSLDVVSRFPFAEVSYYTSDRLESRYSMLVKQTVLTKDAYEWKVKLKKNTEQLGSIFDPQPSQTGGNIHCTTDPNELVVGFVYCSSQTVKRIFVSRGQLPPVYVYSGYDDCAEDTVNRHTGNLAVRFSDGGTSQPLDTFQVIVSDIQIDSFVVGANVNCIDCRMHGGTIVKPDFW